MQNIDKIMLVTGILWSGMMLVFLVTSSPHRQQKLAEKLKGATVPLPPVSGRTRLAALLMFLAMMATSFTKAFHCDLAALTGINTWVIFAVTFEILPLLTIFSMIRDRRGFNKKPQPPP